MLRTVLATLVVVAFAAGEARAQLVYDGTNLMHGFSDTPERWLRNDSPTILSRDIDLRRVNLPYLDGRAIITTQANQLRQNGWLFEQKVLAALSMGGLVAREAYLINPANIAGIVTIASPHQGAPIADAARTAANEAASIPGSFIEAVGDFALGPVTGLSSLVGAMILDFVTSAITERAQASIQAILGQYPGLDDLKTTSPTVLRLASTPDAAPHASVYGVIPRRNAVFRIAYSWKNVDNRYEGDMRTKNRVKSAVKGCRQLLYNIIVKTSLGRLCHRADRAIGSIDGRWAAWTFGNTPGTESDGLIPAARTRYPGTSLTDAAVNFRAVGANHFDVQYNQDGTDQIVRAMLAIEMRRSNVVDRVVVTPASAELAAGSSLQLQATAYDWNNASLVGKPILWQSDNQTVATVSSSGLVIGRTAGTTTVRATIDAVVATMALAVTGVAPPPELYAWVTGTDTVRTADAETWTAGVSGGDGQYTYHWEYQAGGSSSWTAVGSDPSVTLAIDAETRDFVLRLTVSSAGMTRTSEVTIMNRCHSSFGQACFLG